MMESDQGSLSNSQFICEECSKEFTSTSTRNRHIRNIHNKITPKNISKHIICPVCPQEEKVDSYEDLTKHLRIEHSITINEFLLEFTNIEDFEFWRTQEDRDVDYACHRRKKKPNGDEFIYYNCNRSDSRKFTSGCKQRRLKAGGSIKIQGVCPSRILVKILNTGMVKVTFVETHVGHDNELRTKRLSREQQEIIVNKLVSGVSTEEIIQDAGIIDHNKSERMNVLTKGNLAYLIRKFNIDKRRDDDVMIITTNSTESDDDPLYIEDAETSDRVLMNFQKQRKIIIEEICSEIQSFGNSLDEDALHKFRIEYRQFKNKVGMAVKEDGSNRKRKIETPTFPPQEME